MTETPFKNREIKTMFEEVKKDLVEIKTQTTKTNGTVADINKWRERVNGGAIATGAFLSVIVMPVLAWAIYVLVNINQTIHQSIDEALSAYSINSNESQ